MTSTGNPSRWSFASERTLSEIILQSCALYSYPSQSTRAPVFSSLTSMDDHLLHHLLRWFQWQDLSNYSWHICSSNLSHLLYTSRYYICISERFRVKLHRLDQGASSYRLSIVSASQCPWLRTTLGVRSPHYYQYSGDRSLSWISLWVLPLRDNRAGTTCLVKTHHRNMDFHPVR